ncbi:Uroporphyrinogen decarboxylase [Anaerohalosphaera lusitana]|uniref:Uroporphyrinogen decarboxylase n=1 Tax=Anaerohalosphaera lusitana TaxID=1936003 RepID=A0A1U9NM05_9BACT|nr:uroporphyrinogen decarboxylase family protein [Anaerohalosphaera lusitana]AQT68764.1 Uroporphyrinogen decarboxylase [Anaerohalosphaera lusitana]
MNGKERIEKVLQGQWPDQRPVMIHNFMMASREAGISMAEYRSDPKKIAQVHIQAVEKYKLDGVFLDIDTCTTAGALGVPVVLPENETARTTGSHPDLTSLDAVADLPAPDIANDERVQIWVEACRLLKEYFGDEILVRGNCDQLPFSVASMLRGMTEWMMDLMNPESQEKVFQLLDYCTIACEQFVRLMADAGAHLLSHGDSPAGPDMISPDMYVKYAMPYEKKIIDLVHKLNKYYLLHICGDTSAILKDMVATGADALEIDYKTDVNLMHQVCGDCITISGNLNPAGALLSAGPDGVAQEVRDLLNIYNDSPRLIVCSGCVLSPETPAENIDAFVKTVRSS